MMIKSRDIHEQLEKDWKAIFNQPVAASYEDFIQAYGNYVQKEECEVGELTVEKIAEAITDMSNERAVASCGWRVAEMKEIPNVLLQNFVELFKDIEGGGQWPTFMKEVYTTMIEKEADPEIMEVSANNFAAPEPLAMRPIHNFSPWYSA